jgi:hypothetical protein
MFSRPRKGIATAVRMHSKRNAASERTRRPSAGPSASRRCWSAISEKRSNQEPPRPPLRHQSRAQPRLKCLTKRQPKKTETSAAEKGRAKADLTPSPKPPPRRPRRSPEQTAHRATRTEERALHRVKSAARTPLCHPEGAKRAEGLTGAGGAFLTEKKPLVALRGPSPSARFGITNQRPA